MRKLVLTFDILNGVDGHVAWQHGIDLARVALCSSVVDHTIINCMVGIEVKEERRTHAVEIHPDGVGSG